MSAYRHCQGAILKGYRPSLISDRVASEQTLVHLAQHQIQVRLVFANQQTTNICSVQIQRHIS